MKYKNFIPEKQKFLSFKKDEVFSKTNVLSTDKEEIENFITGKNILSIHGGPGFVMEKRDPQEKFNCEKFYGNNSFGDLVPDNYWLFPCDFLYCSKPENFQGCCSILAVNLKKKGSAILALDITLKNLDLITMISNYFNETIISTKFVFFRILKKKLSSEKINKILLTEIIYSANVYGELDTELKEFYKV